MLACNCRRHNFLVIHCYSFFQPVKKTDQTYIFFCYQNLSIYVNYTYRCFRNQIDDTCTNIITFFTCRYIWRYIYKKQNLITYKTYIYNSSSTYSLTAKIHNHVATWCLRRLKSKGFKPFLLPFEIRFLSKNKIPRT